MSETAYSNANVSKLTFGGTAYQVTQFHFNQKADKKEVTQSPNAGKKRYQNTLTGVDFDGEAFITLSSSPFAVLTVNTVCVITWCGDGSTANFASSYCVIDSV